METCIKNRTIKKERIEARVPGDVKDLILAAAKLENLSLSDFVISSALSAAKGVLRDNTILELSTKDQVLFAQAARLQTAYQRDSIPIPSSTFCF